ncbi:MAG: Serine protease [Verrucomicrobiaceae bacterium]|nr:Serine protease [Verrucomicrobiaceae bacterium]
MPGRGGTAFLVAPQRMMTADHCNSAPDLGKLRMVFGYELDKNVIPQTLVFNKDDVFKIKRVVGSNAAQDWAVIELNRPSGRTPLVLASRAGLRIITA